MKTLNEILEEKQTGILEQLKKIDTECVKQQKHLDKGTTEQAYWHYGYAVALKDVLALLDNPSTSQH